MRRSYLQRSLLALTLTCVFLQPLSFARAQHQRDNSTTVTMYSYEWTPSNGAPTAQHPLVYHALQVLADNFKNQTGITIKFVSPVCVSIVQACLTESQRYYAAQIAAGTAPDIAAVPNSYLAATVGYWMNLDPILAQPDPYNPAVKDWCHNLSASTLIKPGQTCHTIQDAHGHSLDYPICGAYPGLVIGEMGNQDLLKKAGVSTAIPTDWGAWLNQLAAIKAKGYNAMSGETTHNGAVAASWPFWSALWPAYMGHVLKKVDPKATIGGTSPNDFATSAQTAAAVKSGIISADDPMFQAMYQQAKKYLSLWVNGWQTADVQTLWTQGKIAERQFYIGDLFSEYSNPDRHFNLTIAFPPYPTKKTDARVVQPFGSVPMGGDARAARASWGNDNSFGIITSAVKRDNNLAATVKWLQYITAPQQGAFIVNEHPDCISHHAGHGQPDVRHLRLAQQPAHPRLARLRLDVRHRPQPGRHA